MNSLPKRIQYRENPYSIIANDSNYYILFKDVSNVTRIIEVQEKKLVIDE